MQNHGETTQHTVSTRWLLSGDGSAPILLHMLPGLPTILVKTAVREHWRSCYRAYIVSLTQINSYKNFLEQRLASLPSFLSPFFFSVIFITTWHILTLHLFAILSRGQKLHKNRRNLSFFFLHRIPSPGIVSDTQCIFAERTNAGFVQNSHCNCPPVSKSRAKRPSATTSSLYLLFLESIWS